MTRPVRTGSTRSNGSIVSRSLAIRWCAAVDVERADEAQDLLEGLRPVLLRAEQQTDQVVRGLRHDPTLATRVSRHPARLAGHAPSVRVHARAGASAGITGRDGGGRATQATARAPDSGRQAGLDPVLDALAVLPHVGVAQAGQGPARLPRCWGTTRSSSTPRSQRSCRAAPSAARSAASSTKRFTAPGRCCCSK